VGHHVAKDQGHILRQNIVPAPHQGGGLGHGGEGQGGPGAGPLENHGVAPGGAHQAHDVVQHLVGYVDLSGLGPQGEQAVELQHRAHPLQECAPLPAAHHGHLVGGGGVADGQAHHEPVHLGVGQKLGAGGPRRVLGGDDQEGLGHRVGHPIHRHLPLLHSLQQGGLGAAGGPVELVGQKEVAQHRAGLVLHPARLLVVEGEARDVRRHHVGGELDPVVPEAQGLGEGQGHGGLAHAGNVLQQDVAPGQNGQQHLCQYLVLAHHGAAHLAQNGGGQLAPLHGNALLIIRLTLHSSRALIYVNEKRVTDWAPGQTNAQNLLHCGIFCAIVHTIVSSGMVRVGSRLRSFLLKKRGM